MKSDLVWACIIIALYAAVAPYLLRWLSRHGYIDISWPEPRRTDNDRRAGDPGARPRAGSDEEGRELRRIRSEEDGR